MLYFISSPIPMPVRSNAQVRSGFIAFIVDSNSA